MKATLSTLVALALSGALLAACDRPAGDSRAAAGGTKGKMDQNVTGGTPKEKQQDPRTTPPKDK